jgi:hypothetical protein
MNSPPFSQNYNSTGKAFLAGKPADAGTLGPYPRSGSDPESIKNKFVAQWAKNPPAKSFYNNGFFNKAAEERRKHYDNLGYDSFNSDSPDDNNVAYDFIGKYIADNGLVPQEEKVLPENAYAFRSEQPGKNIGPNNEFLGAAKLDQPGKNGVDV